MGNVKKEKSSRYVEAPKFRLGDLVATMYFAPGVSIITLLQVEHIFRIDDEWQYEGRSDYNIPALREQDILYAIDDKTLFN